MQTGSATELMNVMNRHSEKKMPLTRVCGISAAPGPNSTAIKVSPAKTLIAVSTALALGVSFLCTGKNRTTATTIPTKLATTAYEANVIPKPNVKFS